jgi:hypothetical protein
VRWYLQYRCSYVLYIGIYHILSTGASSAVPAADTERVLLLLRKLKSNVKQQLKPRPLLVDTPLSNIPTAVVLDTCNSECSPTGGDNYRATPAIETEHVRAVYDTIATHW